MKYESRFSRRRCLLSMTCFIYKATCLCNKHVFSRKHRGRVARNIIFRIFRTFFPLSLSLAISQRSRSTIHAATRRRRRRNALNDALCMRVWFASEIQLIPYGAAVIFYRSVGPWQIASLARAKRIHPVEICFHVSSSLSRLRSSITKYTVRIENVSLINP